MDHFLKYCINLSNDQYLTIYNLAKNLQIIADLSQADIFIDCLLKNKNAAIVIAEAKPQTTQSLYKNSVLGKIAYEDSEPGVIFSLKTGKPVIGSRGISQENVVMQQDVVPIKDRFDKTIAVLIKERDISHEVKNEKIINTFMKENNNEERNLVFQSLKIQEIHHRVKNNLQVISSLLRLQMRRSSSQEVIYIFQESISRISTIALLHDYLAQHGSEEVDVKYIMKQIASLLISVSKNQERKIELSVKGETLLLPLGKATSLALVVNELVQNCLKHVSKIRSITKIEIDINTRRQMAYITVIDNGSGLQSEVSTIKSTSLGIQLVEMLVDEELQGELSYFHSTRGTKVSIVFPIPEKVT